MKKKLSRRCFLKGAAASALTLAGGSMLSTPSVAEETSIPAWAPAQWDYEADVVICGCGIAGVMAARESIAQGHSCLILEKATKEMAGGSSACFAGYYFPINGETLYNLAEGSLTLEESNIIGEESLADFTWLLSNGMTVNSFNKVDGVGEGLYKKLEESLDAIKASVLYETPVKALVQDSFTKEVFGVQAQNASGQPVYVKAKKGVLLATGGANGSNELLENLYLPKGLPIMNVNSPDNTGDGILMGIQAGGALHNMTQHGVELQNFSFRKASEKVGTALVVSPTGKNRGARIFVDSKGTRFMNEEVCQGHYKGTLDWYHLPGVPSTGYQGYVHYPLYMVFDSQLFDTEALGSGLNDFGWAIAKKIYTWSADNKVELEKGWIAKGETIEELVVNLAQQSGHAAIDAEALKATIEAYNQDCAAGSDQFGRSFTQSLGNGPYYAAELATSVMYTTGGLVTSGTGEVLGWNRQPIPRLYAAGDIGQFGKVSCAGISACAAMGTLSARSMVSLADSQLSGNVKQVIPAPGADEISIAVNGIYGFSNGEQQQETSSSISASNTVYKDGTYTGVGNSTIGGNIQVTVNVSGGKVSSVSVNSHNETPSIGGVAFETLSNQAVAANSHEVDNISGATETVKGFISAMQDALAKAQ